jgi:uncharacterized integral membrane protein (TIGR00697 family)
MKHTLSRGQLYTFLGILFSTIVIVSTIASTKITSFGPFVFDAGTILFPLSYIIIAIMAEAYGSKRADFVIIVGFIMQIVASLTFVAVGLLPSQDDWHNQAAYETILGVVPRITLAGVVAYLIGEFLNVRLLAFFKKHIPRRIPRMLVALTIAQLVDTLIFAVIAFAGTISSEALLSLIGTVFGIKIVIALIFAPFSARLVTLITRKSK